MRATSPSLPLPILLVAILSVAGCGGGFPGLGKLGGTDAGTAAPGQPSPPPINLVGRWMLASPGRGQCAMTFSAASPAAPDGTIAPAGGCPGKFFTSRKWTYEGDGLVIRDHTGASLARLSATGTGFDGQSAAGEPVTLTR